MRLNRAVLLSVIMGFGFACQKSKVQSGSSTPSSMTDDDEVIASQAIDTSDLTACNMGASLFLAREKIDGGSLPIKVTHLFRSYEGEDELLVGCLTDTNRADKCKVTLWNDGKTKKIYENITGTFSDQFTIPLEHRGKTLVLEARACTSTPTNKSHTCSKKPAQTRIKQKASFGLTDTNSSLRDIQEQINKVNIAITVNRNKRHQACRKLYDGALELIGSLQKSTKIKDFNRMMKGLLDGTDLNPGQKNILNFANLMYQHSANFQEMCRH